MGYKVAVVGATGNVGREMLTSLEERLFPADEVFAIADCVTVIRDASGRLVDCVSLTLDGAAPRSAPRESSSATSRNASASSKPSPAGWICKRDRLIGITGKMRSLN